MGRMAAAPLPRSLVRLLPACVLLQAFQHRIPRCIFLIPPAPVVSGQDTVDVNGIGQEHIRDGALI